MDLMSSSTTLTGPLMLKSSVETELLKDSPQEALDHLAELTPLRRLGRPQDIAAVVLFLVSLDCEWINGQTIQRERQHHLILGRSYSQITQ